MNSKRALAFIFCTVTLDVLALGLMIPVLPSLVLSFEGGDTARAAKIFGLFATVWGAMQFICSPLLGAMSDRFGRRPIILFSCVGLGLDYIFMAVAPSLTLLFVGRVISGIAAATITTSYAYIADITAEENRAKAFGLVGVAFGLGFILGPAIGGLLGSVDVRLPFWLSAAACLINAAFGWFVLPESLPPERRMAFSWARANPIGSLRLLSRHVHLIGLAAANFFGQMAHQVLPAVFVLYGAYRYGWGESMIGLTLAFVGACSVVVQGFLIGPALKLLGERRATVLGLLAGAVGMAIYGIAADGWLFWIGAPVMSLWGLSGPAALQIMTRLVSPSEQGQLAGANTALASIAGLVAPGIFALTFARLIDPAPGAPFLLAALFLLAAVALAWWVTKPPTVVPSR